MLFLDSCKPVFNISYCKSTSIPLWRMFKKLLQAPNYPLEESNMIFTISISYNVYIVEKESHGCCDTNDINRYETTTCSWHVVRFKVHNYRIEHKLTLNTVNPFFTLDIFICSFRKCIQHTTRGQSNFPWSKLCCCYIFIVLKYWWQNSITVHIYANCDQGIITRSVKKRGKRSNEGFRGIIFLLY